MFRATKIVCLATLVALPACVSQETHRRVLAANDTIRQERDALAEHVSALTEANSSLSSDVQRLGRNAADAQWLASEKQKLAEMVARLGGVSSGGDIDGSALKIEGVSVRQGAEGVIVQVQGEVLFASGQAELTESGRRTIEALAPELMRDPGRLRIEGHTDSDPIRRSQWKTNLRLSCARANAVADFLIGAGYQAESIAVAGYGEHRPIQPGNDDAAKQANRRVEILLLDR